ncbi:MAG: S41 family peptidase, partial [Flavobacteriales bacterium]
NPFPFQGKLLEDKYAYLSLNGFLGMDSISSDNYTDSLQRVVKSLYAKKPLGWIIDIRFNSGGWPYPMIAGLGPILGEGVKAYKVSPNDSVTEFYYAKSKTEYIELSDSVFYLPKELPVAVLIGEETGSAAELLALAFKGNDRTALIGTPTYGVSTGLRGFFMPDSVQFAVSNSYMTDRFKNGNGEPIQPDIYAESAFKVYEQAYEWINENKE